MCGVIGKRARLLFRDWEAYRRMFKYTVNKAHAFVIGRYRPDNLLDALIVSYHEDGKPWLQASAQSVCALYAREM